jgi:hypothetical protein
MKSRGQQQARAHDLAKPIGVKVAVICKERDCTLSSHHRTSIVARAVRKTYAEKIPETKQQ